MSDLGIGLFSGFTNLLNGAFGAMTANADRNLNEAIANKNYRLQQENLDWQKHVQQETWNREDTAISRKMADLRRSGLNPYAAIEGAGYNSGGIVSTQAPQIDFKSDLSRSLYPYLQMISSSIGTALDTYKAVQQAKQSALETQYMKYNLWNDFSFNQPTQTFTWLPDGNAETVIKDNWVLPKNINDLRKSVLGSIRFEDSLKSKAQREGLDISNDILKIDRQFARFNQIADLILDGVQAYRGLRSPYILRPKFDRRY